MAKLFPLSGWAGSWQTAGPALKSREPSVRKGRKPVERMSGGWVRVERALGTLKHNVTLLHGIVGEVALSRISSHLFCTPWPM
jgi:hypothetical protein